MNGKLINTKAMRLKTNYRINPIGIDEKLYRFSWNVD